MKTFIRFLALCALSATLAAQTVNKNVQKVTDGTNALTESLSVPSGKSLTISAGGSLVGAGTGLTGIPYTITGTAGQITASAGTGNITLSLPSALTGITSVTAPAATNLTLNGGSSGASLALGQGATTSATLLVPNAFGNSLRDSLIIGRSGPASIDGAGTGLVFQVPNGAATLSDTVRLGSILTTVAAGSEASAYTISTRTGGGALTEKIRVTNLGNLLIGTTTDITGSGGLKVAGTTASTSTTTGSLINAGGFGNAGNLWVGGTGNFAGNLTAQKVMVTTPSALTYAAPTSVDVTLANVFTVTTVNATGSVTFNATAGGTAGQRVVFIITNDATSAKTITFGTNFVPNGTLTPSGTGKVATIEFISNGTSLYELCRTVLP